MKAKSEKDVKRRITDQLAIQRVTEETRDEETPHELELAAHERKQRFFRDIAAAMRVPRRI